MRNEKFNSEIEGTRKKQGRSFFDPKLAAVKTDQLNLFKVIRRFKNPIYYQFKKILMKTKIENNNFPKLKSTFMPHCVTDQRKWRRSLVHRGTRNKNFPLQKFWLKSQARITTTRKIFDLIETSFVISNFPNIETNTLLPIQKTGGRKHQLEIEIGFTLHNCKLDDRTVHFNIALSKYVHVGFCQNLEYYFISRF